MHQRRTAGEFAKIQKVDPCIPKLTTRVPLHQTSFQQRGQAWYTRTPVLVTWKWSRLGLPGLAYQRTVTVRRILVAVVTAESLSSTGRSNVPDGHAEHTATVTIILNSCQRNLGSRLQPHHHVVAPPGFLHISASLLSRRAK